MESHPAQQQMTATTLSDAVLPSTEFEAGCSSSPLSSIPSSVTSSPLSFLASSPSPPPDMLSQLPPPLHATYPSPPASQQTSQSGSPSPETRMARGRKAANDEIESPPAKRRRTSKDLKDLGDCSTGDYVDLRQGCVRPEHVATMDRVLRVLHKRQKIVVIAGAGMSVSAGIPDFRSSTGLFKSLREEHKLRGSGVHLFDASVYKDDSSTSSFHSMVSSMSRMTKDAKPTLFHHMLATLANEDRLLRLYTQNVDGIDTSLEPLRTNVPLRKGDGGKWPRTIQLHGGLGKMVCSKCHELSDFDPSLFSGPVPPSCPRCEEVNDIRTVHEGKRSHGIGRLRPRMVLYNEHNPDDEAIGTVTRDDLRKRPDAVIVVGTTLKVPGVRRIVREMCGVVKDRRGGVTIWINNDLPPVSKDLEDCFDIVVQGGCDEVAIRAAMRKWDEPCESETCIEISDETCQKAERVKGSVHVTAAPTPPSDLTHAYIVDLPSKRHINNSFSPPAECATPQKVMERPDYSPMTCRKISVFPSTEEFAQADTAITSGLLTPSKSRVGTPLGAFDKLKIGPHQLLSKAGKPKSTKGNERRPDGKPIKTAGSTTRGAPKKKPAAKKPERINYITNTFQTSKTASQDAKSLQKKDFGGGFKSQSELQGVFPSFDTENTAQVEIILPVQA